MPQRSMHSPVGDLTVSEENGTIVSLDWGWGAEQSRTPLLDRAVALLERYFDGDLRAFDLPLAPGGTPFQRRVWAALRAIPPGETRTYGDLARHLGTGPRAIGGACAANRIPILIPCHRVIGGDFSLGGYSGDGGLDTKRALLTLEGAHGPAQGSS